MKVKIGIVGYGNLGKAVEKLILKDKNFKLVAIFSRRVILSKFDTIIEPLDEMKNYIGKIDVMFLCAGSLNDIENQIYDISKYFNSINCFDNHTKIQELIEKVNFVNKKYKTISISACGWDPGLFSNLRAMFYLISNEKPVTVWGKGISMGHSDAIRQIDGVEDAVQFTIPNKKVIKFAKNGVLSENMNLHSRECFVVAKNNKHKEIEYEIKSLPNYFKGQPTTVSFVDRYKITKLRNNLSHKGTIFSSFVLDEKKKASFEFTAKMKSNPLFTAKIMIRYIQGLFTFKNLNRFGAYLPFDFSIGDLSTKKEKEYILKNLC